MKRERKERMPKDQYFLKRLLELRPDIDQRPQDGRIRLFAAQDTIEDAVDNLVKWCKSEGERVTGTFILLETIKDKYYLVPKDMLEEDKEDES